MTEPVDSACWPPTTDLQALHQRGALYRHIHRFFEERNVLEVRTPALARHGVSDLNIDCIAVPGFGYLQSSPEYHMKRLLAAGSGPIYQLGPVFRDGERGSRHNPEFTLLEWYRPGFALGELIDECVALLTPVLNPVEIRQRRFREAFAEATGVDPLTADLTALASAIPADQQLPELDKPALVDWLMACVVEPSFDPATLTVITDFPGWAAALAQTRADDDGAITAQRFEIYFRGLELANGYLELADAKEQDRRFAVDRALRAQHQRQDMQPDSWLLAALAAGMPDCAGVAIGVERLLMAAGNHSDIHKVFSFPIDRA